ENQTNSQQNTQNNNSSVESSTNLSINKNVANAEFYRVNNQIRNIYKNKIWTNFTVSMFNRHLEKGTTPSALFFDKFPRPFLSRDKDFVKEYNEIIEKAQKEIMNLCIKYLSNRIDTMDTDLKNIHEKLRPYFEKDELDSKFDEIESREEYHLRPKMKKSMEKVNRIYAKKFEVLETVNNSDSNISNVSQNNFERSTNGSNRSTNFAGFNRSNVKFTNRYNDYRKRNDKFFSSRSSSKNRFYNSSTNSSLSNLSFNQRNIGRFSRGSSKDRTTNVNTNHRQRFSNSNQNCDSLDCFFKETRHKIDIKNIPLQKETIDFKFELYKNLMNLDYDLNFNINRDQFEALKKYIKYKPFKVIECDKNIGVGLISQENYVKLANDHLENREFYFKLENDPLNEVTQCINSTLRELCFRKDISKSLLKKLLIDKGQLGNFRILAKLHKEKFGIRPIISYKNSIISNLCLLIDLLLQPWVKKLNSFIKDSQNLIQDLNNNRFPVDSKIFSCDFESLYTNMGLVLALKIVTEFMQDKLESEHITIRGFNEILKIVLFNNYFKFFDYFFKQIKGIAMGTKCGPALANIFVNFFEEKFLLLHKPLYYKRYIDDIFIITKCDFDISILSNFFDTLKLNIVGGEEVNFLDLLIKIDKITGKIIFRLFIKPTNSFNYLFIDSNHPNFIFKNIPKGVLIRVRRTCSYFSDYLYYSSKFIEQLEKKGFKYSNLRKICSGIGDANQQELITYKLRNKENFNKSLIMKFPFSKNLTNLKEIIKKSYVNCS
ncbi:unnamed protein product, partial [Brachionus calyciflorus]